MGQVDDFRNDGHFHQGAVAFTRKTPEKSGLKMGLDGKFQFDYKIVPDDWITRAFVNLSFCNLLHRWTVQFGNGLTWILEFGYF